MEISSRALVGYPVQADLILTCSSCVLLYVGSFANKNQSINQSIKTCVHVYDRKIVSVRDSQLSCFCI